MMPEGYQKARPIRASIIGSRMQRNSNQLIIVRCATCRRMMRYLATDLVTLLDPNLPSKSPTIPMFEVRVSGLDVSEGAYAGVG